MVVRDLLTKKGSAVITVEPDSDVGEAAHLLILHNIGGLPVATRQGELVGFIAERDIVRAVDTNDEEIREVTVTQAMRRPAPVCSSDDTLHDVMDRMSRERLRHLVVLDGDQIQGVISVGDLVKHRLEELETEAGVLRDLVAAQRATM
jgi:CBS domain-containing protein